MIQKIPSKIASKKVEICLKKKKTHPSTNIPLLSYRKSEQQEKKNKKNHKEAYRNMF